MTSDAERLLLRHVLATLAYRGAKAVRGAPPEFADFRAGPATRTPVAIVAHVADLLEWGVTACDGLHVWRAAPTRSWSEEQGRFFDALARFEARLANPAPLGYSAAQLFQGPLADALTHVGQISLLRRLAGSPVRGENYLKADIAVGRVGVDQADPVLEFD